MPARRTLLAAAAALLIAGCAQLPVAPNESVRTGRFSGRISFAGKTESASGRYRLSETPAERRLDILTPLSGLIARVCVTPGEATLEKGGEIIGRAPTSEALMAQTLGFSLSVSTLAAWLAGRPASDSAFEAHSTESFTQSGWSVQIKRRHVDGSPAVIAAVRLETAATPGVSLTLTIEEASR